MILYELVDITSLYSLLSLLGEEQEIISKNIIIILKMHFIFFMIKILSLAEIENNLNKYNF